jgi:hypothetical protein
MEESKKDGYVARQRSRAVELAQGVLTGEVNVLEAAWELAALRKEVRVPPDDPDFAVFALIQDETEHLPIGRQRSLWLPEALAAKAAEIAEWEEWAKENSRDACLNITKRFATGEPPSRCRN